MIGIFENCHKVIEIIDEMKYFEQVMLVLCIVFVSSCVDKIDLEVQGHSDLMVIDAMVTDYDSIQIVYIRRERETLDYYDRVEYPPIENVTVHIEDDNGWSADFRDVSEEYGMSEGREFMLKGHRFEPGRYYTVVIRVGDREFKATERMNELPDIDGLKFFSKATKDGGTVWCPILYFKDRQLEVDNYYLFSESLEWIRSGSQNRYVALQRLSDVGLRENLDGVVLSLGMGAEWYMSNHLSFGDSYCYTFMTISKSNYDYYGSMENQINNDGGVYRPTPTSPMTNFSGKDVQGQFVVASRIDFQGRVSVNNIVKR